MKTDPFVGFAGVTSAEQAECLLEMAKQQRLPRDRRLAVGVLTSFKALLAGVPSNPDLYVRPEELETLFLDSPRLLNLVHYNSSEARGLYAQVQEIVTAPSYCDGAQLNVVWPRPDQLLRLRTNIRMHMVLQVGRAAYQVAGGTPAGLVAQLRRYWAEMRGQSVPLIDRVWLDLSGGEGVALDITWALRAMTAIREAELDIEIGVAGGLHAGNLASLRPLLKLDPNLSWDAQSGLQTDGQLDLERCRAFWEASGALLSS